MNFFNKKIGIFNEEKKNKKYAKIYPLNNYCIKCNKLFSYNFFPYCYECDYLDTFGDYGCEYCEQYKNTTQCLFCKKIFNYKTAASLYKNKY